MNCDTYYSGDLYYQHNSFVPDEICIDGGPHCIVYEQGGTSGGPKEYDIKCYKCGRIFEICNQYS